MSDTFITIILVIIISGVMFIFPLMATANQNDAITQTSIQAIVSNFVNNAAKEGKITASNYDEFLQKLAATGNSYDVEIEIQIFDDNPGEKATSAGKDVIGENLSYSIFKDTLELKLETEGVYLLKQGDNIIAKVKNNSVTFGTQVTNWLYRMIGKDIIAIEVSAAALCTTSGQ